MLSKKRRIPKRFFQEKRKFKQYSSQFLSAKIFEVEKSLDTRFAVVVSKKIYQKAVQRNKLKRQIHQMIQDLYPKTKKGTYVVLYPLPGVENLSYREVEEEVKDIFKTSSLIEKK